MRPSEIDPAGAPPAKAGEIKEPRAVGTPAGNPLAEPRLTNKTPADNPATTQSATSGERKIFMIFWEAQGALRSTWKTMPETFSRV
jgi:hypothetical protein